MSVLSPSYSESDVYWRQNSKLFAELAPQNGGKQLIWRNYVTVTLCTKENVTVTSYMMFGGTDTSLKGASIIVGRIIAPFYGPPYEIEQAIIFLSCGFFYLLSFFLSSSSSSSSSSFLPLLLLFLLLLLLIVFPRLFPAIAYWMSILQHMKKIRHLCTIAQICRAVSSQIRHVATIG